MSKGNEKKGKDPVIIFLDITIIILIFVMIYFGLTVFFYKSRADKRSFSQEPGMMSFELQQGDYNGLIQGKYINEFNGDTEADGYHRLADYVEAASLYRVYDTKGYTDKADRQRAVMEDARIRMGELTVFADKVDKMFGIPEYKR